MFYKCEFISIFTVSTEKLQFHQNCIRQSFLNGSRWVLTPCAACHLTGNGVILTMGNNAWNFDYLTSDRQIARGSIHYLTPIAMEIAFSDSPKWKWSKISVSDNTGNSFETWYLSHLWTDLDGVWYSVTGCYHLTGMCDGWWYRRLWHSTLNWDEERSVFEYLQYSDAN